MPGARSHLVDYIYDFHVLRLIRNASSAWGATRSGCCIGRGVARMTLRSGQARAIS